MSTHQMILTGPGHGLVFSIVFDTFVDIIIQLAAFKAKIARNHVEQTIEISYRKNKLELCTAPYRIVIQNETVLFETCSMPQVFANALAGALANLETRNTLVTIIGEKRKYKSIELTFGLTYLKIMRDGEMLVMREE